MTAHPHGTNNRYATGCRCQPCRDAHTEQNRRYRQTPPPPRPRRGTWDDAAATDILDTLLHLLTSDRDPRRHLDSLVPIIRQAVLSRCNRWGCDRKSSFGQACPSCQQADEERAARLLAEVPAVQVQQPAGWARP